MRRVRPTRSASGSTVGPPVPKRSASSTDKELEATSAQVTHARNERRFERTERDRDARRCADRRSRDATTRPPAIPPLALELASEVIDFPRHLGIHSGGMVMADRPLVEFCPIEWARMEGRSVLQWDKDDCAAAGLVKFDLLGLGMLTMLHLAVDMVRTQGVEIDLATIPQEDEVYDLLCAADTVGVFQVESRAQMATLPRLRPAQLLRPRRRSRADPARPDPGRFGAPVPAAAQRRRRGHVHPSAHEAVPEKTLGVPLFQEQLMQLAVDCAGFTAAEADQLRQAMGSKRSQARMERMRERLMAGMAERGITGDTAEEIYTKLEAFSSFGFPESHSVSFAYLVYSSSWIKYHYPAEFAASLLNAQPMGFYSPHSIVRDARRHGVQVLGPDLNASRRDATLEPRTARRRADRPAAARLPRRAVAPRDPARSAQSVRGLHDALLDRIDDERAERAVHRSRRLRAPHRRDRRPGRSARDRGRVRAVLRSVAPRRVVGRGRARHRAAATCGATARSSRRCPVSSPAPTRRSCRA